MSLTLGGPKTATSEPPAPYSTDEVRVALTVNGTPLTVSARHPHLLHALREELDVLSPKDGCSPQGQCGCCTVFVDGKASITCQMPVAKAAGKTIVTLEGVEPASVQQYADAFAACGALQCGFCTPGIIVRAMAQVDKKGDSLGREEMARHLGGHLCRCTGYVKILDAIEALAQGKKLSPETPGGVGTSGLKYESLELAIGARPYIDDLRPLGLLHGAVTLAAHARAEVLAIDTGAAMAVPGVVGVFTAADVPGVLKVGIIHKDWPVFIPVGGRTSYLGDVLAFVVATDREIARRAAELVVVDYEVLRPLTDPVAALDDPENAVWGLDGNRLSTSHYERGDVASALNTSAHTIHEVFTTARIEHAFLEPESTLAVPTVDASGASVTMHVYSGGQGVWDDRNQICDILGIAEADRAARVTVELVSNGGAFGGKEDMSNQGQTALAAWLLGRPVKCTFSREESLLVHSKRHGIQMEYWAGCDSSGRLTALRARMIGDSGPYASVGMKVLERAAGHASGPYHVPAIDIEAIAVRTNNPNCGAFRGFGANQAQFAMEGVLDRLAEKVGISGWEIRKRNVIKPGMVWGPGQIMDEGCLGAEGCLDDIKADYDAAIAAGKAVGLGLGLKNSGLGNGFKEISKASVLRHEDGSVTVRHSWTEMGQGIHSVALQVAVEELAEFGVRGDQIEVLVDTSREHGLGQTTGSRGTLMGAGAVANACAAAKADGFRVDVEYEGVYRVDWTNSLYEGVENPVIHSAFGYAAQMVVVDYRTGKIERVVAVHDVGRAVNPRLCEGQVQGSVHMGLGYALSEEFPSDELGRPTNMTLRSLGILRPKDIPAMDVRLLEFPQPGAPYGIKGVGEIGLVPTAGAVAAALHAYDGTWRARLPMGLPAELPGADATLPE